MGTLDQLNIDQLFDNNQISRFYELLLAYWIEALGQLYILNLN